MSSSLNANKYYVSITNTFLSIKELLEPFRNILLHALPFGKWLVFFLDKLAQTIKYLSCTVAILIPIIQHFIKSIYFKIIVLFILLLLIFGIILSRIINSEHYVKTLENTIYEATGYHAKIGGRVSINIIPNFAVGINNLVIYKDQYKHQDNDQQFILNELSSAQLMLKLQIMPLFLGEIKVKEVDIFGATIDVINNTPKVLNSDSQAQNIINYVNTTLKEQLTLHHNPVTSKPAKFLPTYNIPTNATTLATNHHQPTSANTPNISNDNNLLTTVFNYFLTHISLNFNQLDSLKMRSVNINIINNQKKLFKIEHIVSTIEPINKNQSVSEGHFRALDHNFNYTATLVKHSDHVNIDTQLYLNNDDSKLIHLKVNKNAHTINGSIHSERNNAVITLINDLFITTHTKNPDSNIFDAKIHLSPQLFAIYDYSFTNDNHQFKGDIIWTIANKEPQLIINLLADKDLLINNSLDYINNNQKIHQVSTFNTIMTNLIYFKNTRLKLFNPNNIFINIQDLKQANQLTLQVLTNKFDQLYINDFHLQYQNSTFDLLGKINLTTNNGLLLVSHNGNITDLKQHLQLSSTRYQILQSLTSSDNHNYTFKHKIRFPGNNKIVLSAFQGTIGNQQIPELYVILTELQDTIDIQLNGHLKSLNFNSISKFYNQQLDTLSFDTKADINIFDISPNTSITIDTDIDDLIFHDLHIKNTNLNLNISNHHIEVNHFHGNSEHSGNIILTANIDTYLDPLSIIYVKFNKYTITGKELNSIIFRNTPLVGNIVLDGAIKIDSNTYTKLISNINGELALIKQERLLTDKLSNMRGFFATISKKQSHQHTTYHINDLYGQLNIANNLIEMYPISTLYIEGKKEYRGVASLFVNLANMHINGKGAFDLTQDITKKLTVDIGNTLNQPQFTAKYFKSKQNLSKKFLQQAKKDIELQKEIATKSNQKDNSQFKKNYNVNIHSKGQNDLKNQLYEEKLDSLLK